MKNILWYTKIFLVVLFFVFSVFSTNSAYSYVGFLEGDVLITEFRLEGSQWIELMNTTDNEINLSSSSWELVSLVAGPGSATTTLSGVTIPAKGLATLGVSGLPSSAPTLLSLKNNGVLIYAMSYGTPAFGLEPHFVGFPSAGESVAVINSGAEWIATSTTTRGWYNEAPAPTIASIVSGINSSGITTNLGTSEVSDPSRATGLYFEKTGYGRITFNSTLNLTNSDTSTLLQSFGDKFSANEGSLSFDARTAEDLQSAGAQVKMFGISGVEDSSDALNKLIVKDDEGNVISNDIISDGVYVGNTGACEVGGDCYTFTFNTAHFTQFEMDTTAPTVTKLGEGTSDYYLSTTPEGTTAYNRGDYYYDLIVFSEELSSDSKSAVEEAITNGADVAPRTYMWSENRLRIYATTATTFTDDVTATVADLYGNISTDLLLIDSKSSYIQDQIDSATPGATIIIPAGNYDECLSIEKSLTLVGASATSTILDIVSCEVGPGINIQTSDVSISNLTIINSSDTNLSSYAIHANYSREYLEGLNFNHITMIGGKNNRGINLDNAGGQITNSNIQNFCSGVFLSGSTDFILNGNTISNNGISENCDMRTTGIDVISSSNILIKNNIIADNDVGVYVDDDSSSVTVQNNKITGNNGTSWSTAYGVSSSGSTVNAKMNWWGSITGPTNESNEGGEGDVVSDYVSFSPWYGDDNKTSLRGSPDEDNSYTASEELNATSTNYSLIMASSTLITGTSNWNGEVNPPTVIATLENNPSLTGYTTTISKKIEVGYSGSKLILSRAAKLIFLGEAGKKVGYTRPGESFTEITSVCGANTQEWADANLSTEGDCKIDAGSDLVVWTKHFTQFATYTQTQDTVVVNNGGGGGIAGSGPSSIGYVRTYPESPMTYNAPSSLNREGLQAEISRLMALLNTLKAQAGGGGWRMYNFSNNLMYGMRHNDVVELQRALNGDTDTAISISGAGSKGNETNFFGPATRTAVIKFQKKYGITPALGYVGLITRAKLNALEVK